MARGSSRRSLTEELAGTICHLCYCSTFVFAHIIFSLRTRKAPESLDTQQSFLLDSEMHKKVLFDCSTKRLRTFNNEVSTFAMSSKAVF